MDRWKLLAALALQQHGVVAVWQAAELGITRQVLHNRYKSEGWTRVLWGVYLLPGLGLSPLARIKAVELALRGRGVASHEAAAYLWGLVDRLVRPVPFMVGPEEYRRVSGARIRRSRQMLLREPTQRSGIAVTDADWTVCTLAAVQSVPKLVRTIQIADRTRIATPKTIESCGQQLGRFPNRRSLWAALERVAGELTHSDVEALARRRLRDDDLHPHPRPYTIEDRGTLVAELDIAFVDEQVGIPVDGPHHFEAGQKRLDDDQRHRLRLLGWAIIPVDEYRLEHEPKVFLRQVREALAYQRRRQLQGPVPRQV